MMRSSLSSAGYPSASTSITCSVFRPAPNRVIHVLTWRTANTLRLEKSTGKRMLHILDVIQEPFSPNATVTNTPSENRRRSIYEQRAVGTSWTLDGSELLGSGPHHDL